MAHNKNEPSSKPRFYGRRQGKKLRASRVKLIEDLLPKIAIKPAETPIEPSSLFDFEPDEVWLEVGFGGGEHLARQASRNPKTGFIGSEVFINGVAGLLAHLSGAHDDGNVIHKEGADLEEGRVDNVRVYDEDVRHLFARLPDGCLSRIFVLFPDPWPKRKHARRRFIGPDNLPELARMLKTGGELRVASDDMTYISSSLHHLMNDKNFTFNATKADDWRIPPADWVQTRYEQKAIRQGRKPVYLSFSKTS